MATSFSKKKNRGIAAGKNTNAQSVSYDFAALDSMLAAMEPSFLKDRLGSYLEATHDLALELSRLKAEAGSQIESDELAYLLKDYGKSARLLDLVMAIVETSGLLPASSKITARKIRLAAEAGLNSFVERPADDIVRLTVNGATIGETQIHSAFGRRLAGFFARIVPATKRDEALKALPGGSLLPQQVSDRIAELTQKAGAFYAQSKWDESEACCREILAIDRKNHLALRFCGLICAQNQRVSEAIDFLRQALIMVPDDAKGWIHLGDLLLAENELDEAEKAHRAALKLNSIDPTYLAKLAKTVAIKGDDRQAKELLDRALAIDPKCVEAISNMGYYFHSMYDEEKAALYYVKSLKLMPDNPAVLSNFAILRDNQRKPEEALELIDRSLKIEPPNKIVMYFKGHMLMGAGRYEEAWPFNEYRLVAGIDGRTLARPPASKRVWNGTPDKNLKLLLIAEQGLGDVLQFVRYAKLCKEHVGKVYVMCPQPLVRLFENCPFIDKVAPSIPHWRYDEYVMMMSLPYLMKTTWDTIPGETPYLFTPQEARKKWANLQGSESKKFKIGLVWSGSMFTMVLRGDQLASRRNMNLRQMLPLFDVENTVFYSLQLGAGVEQIDELGLRDRMIDPMADVKDMADTAAIIEHLDLVISVDTSVVHLAGGLGKPVWVLSRYDACWRWHKNQPENPWYPNARVFGQPRPGDWQTVISEVADALRLRVAEAGQQANAIGKS